MSKWFGKLLIPIFEYITNYILTPIARLVKRFKDAVSDKTCELMSNVLLIAITMYFIIIILILIANGLIYIISMYGIDIYNEIGYKGLKLLLWISGGQE